VKDQFNVQGIDTTLGYVGRSFKPAKQDAVLVVMLRKLGAIIITKTAIPQSILVSLHEQPNTLATDWPTSGMKPKVHSGALQLTLENAISHQEVLQEAKLRF
jgi:Asp-tRNA(Asn)/Glu-tRNA(Gln) amidotransferase A subunit family amidase